MTNCNQNLI